jgi:hypothetical protein
VSIAAKQRALGHLMADCRELVRCLLLGHQTPSPAIGFSEGDDRADGAVEMVLVLLLESVLTGPFSGAEVSPMQSAKACRVDATVGREVEVA